MELMTAENIDSWSVDDLCDYIYSEVEHEQGEAIIPVLRENRINGKTFTKLKTDDLKELFPVVGDRLEVSLALEKLTAKPKVRSPSTISASESSCPAALS